jgi:hypothetical protein
MELETRYQLFALRDALRSQMASGEIEDDPWFDYLDSTITKTIGYLHRINIWEGAALYLTHRNDPLLRAASNELLQVLREPQKEAFATLYQDYVVTVARFLVNRHYVITGIFRESGRLSLDTLGMIPKVWQIKEDLAKLVSVAPETSTLIHYCQQPNGMKLNRDIYARYN